MVYYNGAHSITFLKKRYDYYPIYDVLSKYDEYHDTYKLIKNTWDDWKLIPLKEYSISPPLKKRNIIDLPGSIGSIEISDFITGYPLYSNRTGSLEFYIIDNNLSENKIFSLSKIYSEILDFFNDNNIMMILDDDKFFYYQGNFWISSFDIDSKIPKMVIDYDLYPYKQAIVSSFDGNSTGDYWLWDPFDFNKGYIQESYNWTSNKITNTSNTKMTIICGNEPKNIAIKFQFTTSELEITVKCRNTSLITGLHDSDESKTIIGGGTLLFDDLLKNVNMEKQFTFEFNKEGTTTAEIEYYGGFL